MSLNELLWNVSRFGGAHVILPASTGIFLGLRKMEQEDCARAFLAGLAFCVLSITCAKIVLLTAIDFSPSGHTAFSTFFYASVGFLAVSLRPSVISAVFAGGLSLLIVLIGVSRFWVAGHTRLEVVIGLACGIASFQVFRRRARLNAGRRHFARAALIALTVAIILNRLMSLGFVEEDDLRDFSQYLRMKLFSA